MKTIVALLVVAILLQIGTFTLQAVELTMCLRDKTDHRLKFAKRTPFASLGE